MKTILVPLYGDKKEASALEVAFILGKQFGSHVRGLHVSPRPQEIFYGDPMIPMAGIIDSINKELKKQAKRAQTCFENIAAKHHIPITKTLSPEHETVAASWWHKTDEDADKAVAEAGRMADVIIISRVITEQHEDYSTVVITALFETGRPVMLIPPGKTPESVGKNIVIAWDGSQHCVHAIAMANPLLLVADKVRIITVDEGKQEGPKAQDLINYLEFHNIKSDHVSIYKGNLSIGAALLDEAKKQQADLIVMGAYTHSRIRQMVVGGATSFMMAHAELPVFMMY